MDPQERFERAALLEEWLQHYFNAVRFGSKQPDKIADVLCPLEDTVWTRPN